MKKFYILMCIICFTFVLGVLVGARLAFEGIIKVPPYCYGELQNDISHVEIVTDSGETIFFDKRE